MGQLRAPLGPAAIHLCIDMQMLFAPDGPWASAWMDNVLPAVIRICRHAGEHNVFTRFIVPASADTAGGMWKAYYRKWEMICKSPHLPEWLELIPALREF